MSYMKLIKLLYLVDREALLRWGRPVSTDRYVSMDKGPVLSRTLSLINEGGGPDSDGPWSGLISAPGGHEVSLLVSDPPDGELSPAEDDLIKEIFASYGHLSRWELVEHLHTLAEWTDPNGSALPISYRDILRAGGKTEEETAMIEEELESLEAAELLI